jgi:hypothetical protein
VISLSVGATGHAPQYDHDSIAIGAFSASQHGIVVPCSAGNSGLKVQRITNFLLYKVVNKDGDAEQDAARS